MEAKPNTADDHQPAVSASASGDPAAVTSAFPEENNATDSSASDARAVLPAEVIGGKPVAQ